MKNNSVIRVALPYHLQNLAGVGSEVMVQVDGDVTVVAVVRALEGLFPMLRGAILQHQTGNRRPLIRFFACGKDVSIDIDNQILPMQVSSGDQPLMIVGAIAGG